MKREERRHGRFQGVAEGCGQFPRRGRAGIRPLPAAGGRTRSARRPPASNQMRRRSFLGAGEAAVGPQLHSGVGGGAEEAVNNRLRRIGDWEHAAVAFGFDFDAARFKPGHRVARLENLVRGQQSPAAARIAGAQLARVEAGMGDVAAAPAGDAAAFSRNRAPRSRTVTRAPGRLPAQAMAAKIPAGPPPATTICRKLMAENLTDTSPNLNPNLNLPRTPANKKRLRLRLGLRLGVGVRFPHCSGGL